MLGWHCPCSARPECKTNEHEGNKRQAVFHEFCTENFIIYFNFSFSLFISVVCQRINLSLFERSNISDNGVLERRQKAKVLLPIPSTASSMTEPQLIRNPASHFSLALSQFLASYYSFAFLAPIRIPHIALLLGLPFSPYQPLRTHFAHRRRHLRRTWLDC